MSQPFMSELSLQEQFFGHGQAFRSTSPSNRINLDHPTNMPVGGLYRQNCRNVTLLEDPGKCHNMCIYIYILYIIFISHGIHVSKYNLHSPPKPPVMFLYGLAICVSYMGSLGSLCNVKTTGSIQALTVRFFVVS